jgi:2'-5' RNA ligase
VSARLFVAIDLPAQARAQLAEQIAVLRGRLRRAGLDDAFRWVAPANLHITLRFLGDVADEAVARVVAAMSAPLADAATGLTLARLGTFPGAGRPRIVHVAVEEGSATLGPLRDEVDARLAPLCTWTPETRPFSPHLTLARSRDRAPLESVAFREMMAAESWPPLAFAATEVTLFRSITHATGPEYSVLARAALRSG